MAFRDYSDVAAALQAESNVWAAGQGHTDEAIRQRALAAREWWASQQTTPSSPTTSTPPPPPAKPASPWITASNYVAPEGVKQADPDIVLIDTETISPELLIQLEYENVSGTELINISRSDIIDGQQVVYSPIKNLSSLRRKYNPNNIIAISSGSASIFSKYLIDINSRGIGEPYFDNNGDLVIEVSDVFDDELIEAEVDTSGTIDRVEFS